MTRLNDHTAAWRRTGLDGQTPPARIVETHYNRVRTLGLTAEQQRDLVEYLKSR